MAEVAAELRDEDGADVLIMGCAAWPAIATACQRHVVCPSSNPARPPFRWPSGRARLNWA